MFGLSFHKIKHWLISQRLIDPKPLTVKRVIGILVFCVSVIPLFTVCYVDSFLWQGVTTGKYFWFAAVMCIVIPISLGWGIGQKFYIRRADIWVFLFVGYIVANYWLCSGWPDMHWWLFLLMIPLYMSVRTICENGNMGRWVCNAILLVVLVEAIWGLMQLYGYSWSYHGLYKVTGSLFNPGPYAGFVAVGVPLALGYTLDKNITKWEHWFGIFTLLTVMLVLPATMSRAAWMAAIIGSIPVLWNRLFGSGRQLSVNAENPDSGHRPCQWFSKYWRYRLVRIISTIVLCVFFVGLLTGMYYLKKGSADGRWLIWNVSMEIVKDHPLLGTGYGTFSAVYGDAQAGYFLSGKGNEAQEMVADSPDDAFNEYVQMAVELGLVGFGLFIFLIIYCLFLIGRSFRQTSITEASHQTSTIGYIKWSLLAFLVFAAFSYPFSMLPLVIIFVFLLAILASSSRSFSFSVPVWLRVAFFIIGCGITIYGAHIILPQRAAYREWQSVQMLYQAGIYESTVKDYQALYPQLGYQKQFLFEYGQCLSKTGQYVESNRIFAQFLHYGSDPMVYNCMGNNYKEMKEYEKAETSYIHASQIIPNRHYPLYLLMKLYEETGQIEKARAAAQSLLVKPVKVNSTAIREMQQEAKQLLKK